MRALLGLGPPLLLALLVGLTGCGSAAGPQPAAAEALSGPPVGRWLDAAGFSQDGLAPSAESVTDSTVRMIVRVTAAGAALRVRLENTFGTAPVVIGAASVGRRDEGASLAGGSLRPLTFGGAPGVTLPAGGGVTSDPVSLAVEPGQDLAVSLYVPGSGVRASWHRNSLATSYRAAAGAGDRTGDEWGAAFSGVTAGTYWLTAVDVHSADAAGTIAVLGSSTVEGVGSTFDGHNRWTDRLAARLQALPAESRRAAVNAGIGGNRLLRGEPPGNGPPGLERLDRDVLDRAGVTHVLLHHGSNDINVGASAEAVIFGLQEVLDRARARGVAVIGATLAPRTFGSTNVEAKHAVRHAVNDWIRGSPDFVGVVDVDAVLRDPTDPDRLAPEYDAGDGTHPNPAGHAALAESVDLQVFETEVGGSAR